METDRERENRPDIEVYLEQARLRLSHRELDAAEQLLRHAAALEPAHAGVLNLWGVTVELQGRLQEAARCYRAAISLAPAFAQAADNLHRVVHWPYKPKGIERNLGPGEP